MLNENKSLGEKLRDLRESFDLSQNQIAAALNIDRSTYTNYELDKTRPSLESLVKLARIFHITAEELLPIIEDDDSHMREMGRPNGMVQTLNKEERGLIVLYRALDKESRAKLRGEIKRLTAELYNGKSD